jgi:FtsP/CotA-like multicopper oxidase with cupredoxin domain
VNFVEFAPADACEVRVVAYDGVYRSKIPHETPNHKHMLTTSSRVDLAVKCNRNADMHFHQGSVNQQESRMVSLQTTTETAEAEVLSSPFWDADLQTQWTPRRPYYMGDLLSPSSVVDEVWNITMDKIIVDGKKLLSMNHQRWDPNVPIRSIEMNRLVELTVWNTKHHPFHIHINRMQIVKGCGYRYEEGEYYDSIAAKTDPCTVRLKFLDFAGRVVAHCHKLNHEDKGMMVWLNVTGGPGQGVSGDAQEDCLALS